MSKEDQRVNPYPVRLSKETKQALEAIAKANGRSLNAQMVLMLESALVNPTLHLGNGMRRQLEEAARCGGRSLHAEILMRLEASLDLTKLDWERYIDPVVCARLEGAACSSGKTIEEEISHRLQQSLDSQDLTAFDEQIMEAAIKLRGKPTALESNELLIRKIVRDELAKAGIKPVDESSIA